MKNRKTAKVQHIPKSLKTLARSVGRKSRSSIARQALKDSKIKKKVLDILQKDLQKEMREMCRKKSKSVLREGSPEALQAFSWELIVE